MRNKKIVITGGTGFIGQALAQYFGKDNKVVIIGRSAMNMRYSNNSANAGGSLANQPISTPAHFIKWNGKDAEETWASEFNGSDLIINLAGKSVNCRYHAKQKQAIIDSRILTTKAVGEAIRRCTQPPPVWINASSATFYRDSRLKSNDEFTGIISPLKKNNMPFNMIDHLRFLKNRWFARLRYGKDSAQHRELELDFSIKVCQLWENTFFDQSTPGTRKIALRAAITLGKGGVMTPYLNLCKFGLGGNHGDGKQMFSWVHVEDLARMIAWLYENKNAEGAYNCAAPHAVTNKELMQTLRQVTGVKIGLPATTWMLEAGAWLIGTETELMLKSRWVQPARAVQEGFVFNYPLLEPALRQIISQLPRKRYRLWGR